MSKNKIIKEKPRTIELSAYPAGAMTTCHGCETKVSLPASKEQACKHYHEDRNRLWLFHALCIDRCVQTEVAVVEKDNKCPACREKLTDEGMCENPKCEVW